uniref:Uncharacterized protein n=1 Tax=Oryza punctata TaxID=4537 RepID=A0A0E0KN12_ORYPU
MKASTVAVLVIMAMLMMSVAVYSDDASSHGVTEKQIAAAANSHGSNGESVTEAASTDSSTGSSGTSSAGVSGTNINSNYYVSMKGYMDYIKRSGGNKQP